MTSMALSDPDATVTPPPEGGGSTDAAGRRRVAGVHHAIDRLDVAGLGEGEHAAVLQDLERAKRRLDSALLAVLASADKARVGERAGHTGTGSWASWQTKCGGGEGFAQSRLATDIDDGL